VCAVILTVFIALVRPADAAGMFAHYEARWCQVRGVLAWCRLPRGTLFCNVFKVQLARVASFDSRRDLILLALPYSGHGEEGEDDEHMQDSAEHQPSR
jgi:hypothetical protein